MSMHWLFLTALAWSTFGSASAGEVTFEGEGHAYHPIWSVDGRFLAFEVNRYAGDVDMFIATVNGSEAKPGLRVTLPGGSNAFSRGQVVVNPAWHKDGFAVFEGSNQGGNFRIYYRSATGGEASEMIPTTELPGDLTFPTVSRDGKKMAFVADQTGAGDIRLRDTQTNKLTQVTSSPVAEMFPMFSADGTKLLFTRKNNGSEDVYELAIGSTTEKSLASGVGDQTRPVYAESGSVLFFDGSRGEEHWDVVMASGGARMTLAKDVRLPLRARPALTPDGRWVALAYNDPTKSDKIVLIRVDGSRTVEIPTTFTACGEPALTSQGGRILLAYTALPSSGADWRFLYVQDITERL